MLYSPLALPLPSAEAVPTNAFERSDHLLVTLQVLSRLVAVALGPDSRAEHERTSHLGVGGSAPYWEAWEAWLPQTPLTPCAESVRQLVSALP